MALDVIAITGIGGMGIACARRLGSGNQLLLSDINAKQLESAAEALRDDGFSVQTQVVDVADSASVEAFAKRASELGFIRTLVHTAGISPLMADPLRIYSVDLVGTANVLDTFSAHMNAGSTAVIIASMASKVAVLDADLSAQLATAPTNQLIEIALGKYPDDANMAYALAKRGNQLRVEETAVAWGQRGVRVVSVSPGLIATPMARLEQNNPQVAHILSLAPLQRIGTAEDIANLVQWLTSPAASYITGVDIGIDGGTIAAMRSAGHIAR